ncbi:MAG: cytidylyltransferase domain-containing protein [Acidimicrobiales bacterium]
MAEILGVIPARGGSKGIPGKNIIDLGGRPLVTWTIAAALETGVFDRLIVSSDDPDILSVSAQAGTEVDRRAEGLAADHVHAVHVVLDLLERLGAEGYRPDVVVMLLPTSPFRRAADVVGAIDRFLEDRPPAVISVTELDKQLIHLRTIDAAGRLQALVPPEAMTAQRQEQPPLYGLNGSIYVARPETVLSARTFHVADAVGHVMDATSSVDINEPADLDHARRLIETGVVT